eukprot:TRINITY_DN694_c0_g1_i2.p1 TRINITY_DN694_c0_g1~~TRINITY_DN694_c0_g1_i2.p1  ORF type:complete len:624 (-),score=91.78 TRINITY_DN694_c0_g1_i2:199-2070(-)
MAASIQVQMQQPDALRTSVLPALTAVLTAASLPQGPVSEHPGPGSFTTPQGCLPAGLHCRYYSETHGWMPCNILRFHGSDGTYDLDVRQRASAGRVAPSSSCPWPFDTKVFYHSQTSGVWMPARVVSFNACSGTYKLTIHENAEPDRIRARSVLGTSNQQQVASNLTTFAVPAVPTPSTYYAYPQTAQPPAPAGSAVPPPPSPPTWVAPQSTSLSGCTSSGTQNQNQNQLPYVGSAALTAASMSSMVLTPPLASAGQATAHPADITLIRHPGQQFSEDDVLVGVIVTISDGTSYDALFTQVPQVAGEGQRVATYGASPASLPHLISALSGNQVQERLPGNLYRNLRRLVADVTEVQPDSVVFNWECCSGCCGEHFQNGAVVMNLVKHLLDRGHMVMFSDFSLKALIKEWRDDLLGLNPFIKVSEFGGTFQLRFDPAMLQGCPSAQLQKLGELASDGKAHLHAMGGTIAFSVDWTKADCSAYSCQVLTVMSQTNGQPVDAPVSQHSCEVGGHRGWAGHVLLSYPSGGRLIASAGHWVELTHLDVNEADLLRAAASYGAAFSNEVRASMSSCVSDADRQRTIQTYSSQMVQQSSPACYSLPPMSRSEPSRVSASASATCPPVIPE